VDINRATRWSCLLPAIAGLVQVAIAAAEPAPPPEPAGFTQFLHSGSFDAYLRYRFEFVDDAQNAALQSDAYAHTVRTALGYKTGLFHGLGARFQIEDVRALAGEKYNDGGANGVTDRAVVADPEGVEINEAYLRFEGVPHAVLRVGRQEIEHRQAPLHRFVGNILWRQNWQSFDAARATTTALPDTTLDYAYVWNVNRVFGEHNPVPDRDDFRMDSHLFNVVYAGFDLARIEAYAYLLDFESDVSKKFSTSTFGVRAEGTHALAPRFKALYVAEFARQDDFASNPNDIGVAYWLAEGGLVVDLDGPVEAVTLKAAFESLGGKGGVEAFQTPLGTNHPFQGWADRFLVTPGDGVHDLQFTLKAVTAGATLSVVYHDFSSDHDDYDYGSEWDLQLEKPFLKNYAVGLKYARYDADRNALNVARNSVSGQAFDIEKFWAYVQAKF